MRPLSWIHAQRAVYCGLLLALTAAGSPAFAQSAADAAIGADAANPAVVQAAPPGAKQAPRPFLVVSLAPVSRWSGDLDYLGGLIDQESFSRTVWLAISAATKLDEVDGFDRDRPLGVIISSDELLISPVGVLPVTKVDGLLAALKNLVGSVQTSEDGLYKFGTGTSTGYLRPTGKWVFVGQSRDVLENLPDPVQALGTLPAEYNAAIQFRVAALPEVFRGLALDQIQLVLQETAASRPNDTSYDQAQRRHLAAAQFHALQWLFAETGEVTLGLKLDSQRQKALLDLRIVPRKQTAFSSLVKQYQQQPAAAGSLLEGAIAAQLNLPLTPPQTKWLQEQVTLGQQALAAKAPAVAGENAALGRFVGHVAALLKAVPAQSALQGDLCVYGDAKNRAILGALHCQDAVAVAALKAEADKSLRMFPDWLEVTPAPADQTDSWVLGGKLASRNETAWLSKLVAEERIDVRYAAEQIRLTLGPPPPEPAPLSSPPGDLPENTATLLAVSADASLLLGWWRQMADNTSALAPAALLEMSLQNTDDQIRFRMWAQDDQLRGQMQVGEGLLRAGALAAFVQLGNRASAAPAQ